MRKWLRFPALVLPAILVACSTAVDDGGTIGQLRNMHIDIKEEQLEGGLEKAMASYQRFLREAPDTALAPEAIRRLADLKVEHEYGLLAAGEEQRGRPAGAALPAPERATRPEVLPDGGLPDEAVAAAGQHESEAEFERRASGGQQLAGVATGGDELPEDADDLERAGPLEAIELYKKLLREYPLYPRNDQVLYQMSRAYEELGRIEEAMEVMARLVREFPESRYIGEVQFRRAEYFFTRRRYLDAEEAYGSIVAIGVGSSFYELALYKLGWTFYKQELYEEALHKFIALLDYKVAVGYDFEQTEDEAERKRLQDTFRVISLSFSSLGGADAVVDYFSRHGKRSYEDGVYANLGEYYLDKRRYADATATYQAFVSRNPFHEKSPHFHMRVIEINKAGGFPSLVIDSKKEFAATYGLQAEYWFHFDPDAYPDVLGYLKTNLTDLANHYHALYQDPACKKEKQANFKEAHHWYREFLASFPAEQESPAIHYQLADLLLENRAFAQAAIEYEKTAYDYPRHEKSAQAGYAAVYAHREHLGTVVPGERDPVKREVVRSSLRFAETYPEHEKSPIVLGAAVDDLYAMKDYEPAVAAAHLLIEKFPAADGDVLRAAWLVAAHASYELERYGDAEEAYVKVLALLPPAAETRKALVDNLAASIYKQGEVARAAEDHSGAAEHFLRVGRMAPNSTIRPTAEYDAAAALILLKDWEMAATVLVAFRSSFPGHELQPEVTKKIAYVYREDGQLSRAAAEYERIERESDDVDVRREALLVAAELHEETGDRDRALGVYRRYVDSFPQPVETNLETRNKIAELLKENKDEEGYLEQLGKIVAVDASAGSARTERTRYLAAKAALVLAERSYKRFAEVRLVEPFEVNLRKKQELMKAVKQEFGKLIDYEIGEVTAAATFYLAEIYAHFSKALMESERPEGLSPLELEQYELAIEDQAYPFEEQAIDVHVKNLELMSRGIYNEWIDKSLQKLAKFVPARYAKQEEVSGMITSLDTYIFEIETPAPPRPSVAEEQVPSAAAAVPGGTESALKSTAIEEELSPPAEPPQAGVAGQVEEAPPAAEPERVAEPDAVAEPERVAAPVKDEEAEAASPSLSSETKQDEQSEAVGEPQSSTGPERVAEAAEVEKEPGGTEPAQAAEVGAAEEPMPGTEPEAVTEQEGADSAPVEEPAAGPETDAAPVEEEPEAAEPTPSPGTKQIENQERGDEPEPETDHAPEPGEKPGQDEEPVQASEPAGEAALNAAEEGLPDPDHGRMTSDAAGQ